MNSKQALIVALLAGAGALLVVLGGLLSLAFLEAAGPYLGGRETRDDSSSSSTPRFTTFTEDMRIVIVEIDQAGLPVRTVYTSDLQDQIADFTLFAVPQSTYSGKIYVQSVQDADSGALIVYPLNTETGKISPAILNVVSNRATLSPEQNRVAVINTTQITNVSVYDLATGAIVASWTLDANERLTEGYSRIYGGNGVRWVDNSCFEHGVWVDNDMEIRTFCIENTM